MWCGKLVNHKNQSWKRPLGSQGYPLPILDGSLWFIPECFVQTGFKSTIHPTRRGEKKEQQQKNVSCPSISLVSPTQEREAWGHREGRDESWDMRAGRDFRGHLVQHRISRIKQMRIREFKAQSHKDYMRPVTREQGLVHRRCLTNIGSTFLVRSFSALYQSLVSAHMKLARKLLESTASILFICISPTAPRSGPRTQRMTQCVLFMVN